jgi:hypothetical protein
MDDSELAAQPAAYWTGVAYQALISFTRARQASFGYTQPQFWILRHLSVNDLSDDGQGRTVFELRQAMRGYLRAEDDLGAEGEALLDRGLVSLDDHGRLWITPDGEAARVLWKSHAPRIRSELHAGIPDGEYVAALKVLHRLIRNAGGEG